MKKRRFLIPLLALLCLCAALTLIACGDSTPEHTHTYDEWVETTAPTCAARGIKTRVCDCGHSETQYIDIDPNTHVPASTWTADAFGHWQKCSQTDCTAQLKKATHSYNEQNVCTVCEHAYVDIGLKFTLRGSTYKVSDYTGTAIEVGIPATYKGVAVTSIGSSAFKDCSNLTTIIIPASVTSIGSYAFQNCSNLTTITIPTSVTSIGDWAFRDCSNLATITIPDSVTKIGDWVFRDCSNLATVEFGTNSQLRSVGYTAFYNCDSLTTITIPASVTSIGDFAFFDCSNLTTITIPASVTSIGEGVFSDCSQLTTVYYGGSASDWGKITISSIGNYELTYATRYYYSATEPTTAGNWWYYDQNGKPAVWGV